MSRGFGGAACDIAQLLSGLPDDVGHLLARTLTEDDCTVARLLSALGHFGEGVVAPIRECVDDLTDSVLGVPASFPEDCCKHAR